LNAARELYLPPSCLTVTTWGSSAFVHRIVEGPEAVVSKFSILLRALKSQARRAGKKPFQALQKEVRLGKTLHAEVLAALKQLQQKHPKIKEVLADAAGYAVVPSIGRASLVLGGAYGLGEVFARERVVGYAAIVELTLGVQLGGATFHELIVFRDAAALKRFKAGKFAFAADAAVEMVKAGAQASHGFGADSSIFVFAEGGMLLDLAIGVQKFIYRPALFGRLRTSKGGLEEDEKPDEERDQKERDQGKEQRRVPAQKQPPALN
jgi:hypothetical protein